MHNFSLHQNLLHRHKRIPLFSQFINDRKCRFHRRFRRIVKQNDIIFPDLVDHSFAITPELSVAQSFGSTSHSTSIIFVS